MAARVAWVVPLLSASHLLAHPPAVTPIDTQYERLPLHIAEEKGTSPENIELLLATYPDAINVKDPLKGLV